MNIKHALLGLATLFTVASCQKNVSNTNTEKTSVDEVDYRVTALTQQGDTLWSVVTDEMFYKDRLGNDVSQIGDSGARALEKSTGLLYTATPGTTVVAVPFKPHQ